MRPATARGCCGSGATRGPRTCASRPAQGAPDSVPQRRVPQRRVPQCLAPRCLPPRCLLPRCLPPRCLLPRCLVPQCLLPPGSAPRAPLQDPVLQNPVPRSALPQAPAWFRGRHRRRPLHRIRPCPARLRRPRRLAPGERVHLPQDTKGASPPIRFARTWNLSSPRKTPVPGRANGTRRIIPFVSGPVKRPRTGLSESRLSVRPTIVYHAPRRRTPPSVTTRRSRPWVRSSTCLSGE
jgi:hypothetical protein